MHVVWCAMVKPQRQLSYCSWWYVTYSTFLSHVENSVFSLKDNSLVTLISWFPWFLNAEELEDYIPSTYILSSLFFFLHSLNHIIKYIVIFMP